MKSSVRCRVRRRAWKEIRGGVGALRWLRRRLATGRVLWGVLRQHVRGTARS